jgi:hypothetical protein
MTIACHQSADFHESLDPFARAIFNVSWAGEETSPNWFDTARELTERWHHQQQIRLATHRPGIMTRELYNPVIGLLCAGFAICVSAHRCSRRHKYPSGNYRRLRRNVGPVERF